MDVRQQQQDIAGQMRECPIALLIFAPAAVDLSTPTREVLVRPCAFGMVFWQRCLRLFNSSDFLLEFINLTARAGLLAIKTARVQEKRTTHLLAVFIDGRGSQ